MRRATAVIADSPEWVISFADYFSVSLNRAASDRWFRALEAECRDLDEAELASTIRWASFKHRGKYRPTLKDLRMWVFWRRKEERSERAQDEQADGCGKCSNGWILYTYERGECMTPCNCEAGRAEIEKRYPPHLESKLLNMAAVARTQHDERQRINEEWAQRWIAAGRPSPSQIIEGIADTSLQVPDMRSAMMAIQRRQRKEAFEAAHEAQGVDFDAEDRYWE